jgi:fibro-slime domain-containing protein
MKHTFSLLLAMVLCLVGYTIPVAAEDGAYLTPESIQKMRDTRKRGDDPTKLCEDSCKDFEESCKEVSKDAEKQCKNYKDEEKSCKASCEKDKACEKTCDSYYKEWEKLCKKDVKDWETECKEAAKDCKSSCNQSFVFVLLDTDNSIPVIDLTPREVSTLSIDIVINFTSQHIIDLPVEAIAGFKPEQVKALPPKSLEALSPEQALKLSIDARQAFSREQIKYMQQETVEVLSLEACEGDDCDEQGNEEENGNEKVTVCHNGKDLVIAQPAVEAHLNQGATLGPCEDEAPVACTLEYMPVCGKTDDGKFETFGNMCNLEVEKAKLIHKGECDLDLIDELGNPDTLDTIDENGNPTTDDDIVIEMPDMETPDVLKLIGFVRDLPADHPDVEGTTTGLQQACVESSLDTAFFLPVPTEDNACNISESDWYLDVLKGRPHPIELEYEQEGGTYSVLLDEFFPIDDEFLGNEGREHNYHFSYELHASFISEAEQFLTVGSDDDLWVFLNGDLIIDLGGTHAFEEASVELDSLELKQGEEYVLSFFFAERRTSSSSLAIDTNIMLKSKPIKPSCEDGEECEMPKPCEDGEECEMPKPCEDGEECEMPKPCEDGEECEMPKPCEDGEECEMPKPCEDGEECEMPKPCEDGEECEKPNIEDIDFSSLNVELVSNLSLNIIINLTAEQVAQIPEDAMSGFDEQQIAYIPPKACEGLTKKHIEKVKPEAARGFQKQQVKYVKPEAVSGFKYEHIEYFKHETVSGFNLEQFESMEPEALGGFTPDNIGGLPTEVVEQKGIEILQKLEQDKLPQIPQHDVSWILLNAKHEPRELPQTILINLNVEINPETGYYKLPVGKLRLPPIKTPELTEPEAVELPEIPNFNSPLNIAGFNQSVIEQVNQTFINMNFSQFTSMQNNGIFEVQGNGEFDGVKFNFIPDESGLETVEQGTPEGISIDKGGRVVLVTSTGLKTRLLPAPRDPEHILKALPGCSMKMDKRGITRLKVPQLNRTIFGVFDSELQVAEPELSVGLNITGTRGIDEKAVIVYEDGFKQTIRPAIADLDLLATAREGLIDATRYGKYFMHSGGHIYMVYGEKLGRVVPTFDVDVNIDIDVSIPTILPAGDDDELAVLVTPDGEQQVFAYEIIGDAEDYDDYAEQDD